MSLPTVWHVTSKFAAMLPKLFCAVILLKSKALVAAFKVTSPLLAVRFKSISPGPDCNIPLAS